MSYRVVAVDVTHTAESIDFEEETIAEFDDADEAIDYMSYHASNCSNGSQEIFVESDSGILAWSVETNSLGDEI